MSELKLYYGIQVNELYSTDTFKFDCIKMSLAILVHKQFLGKRSKHRASWNHVKRG